MEQRRSEGEMDQRRSEGGRDGTMEEQRKKRRKNGRVRDEEMQQRTNERWTKNTDKYCFDKDLKFGFIFRGFDFCIILCAASVQMLRCIHANGVFPLPDSYSDSDSYSDNMQKGSTGTYSDGHSDVKSQWKLVKFHLISTNISVKLGTVPICIGIGIGIGIGISSVETVLHIIILAI